MVQRKRIEGPAMSENAIGPGTRVLCLRGSHEEGLNTHLQKLSNWPTTGSVYTVESVVSTVIMWDGQNVTAIYLIGWHEICPCCGKRQAYLHMDFRPLDGDAEIEKLRALLKEPNNTKAPSREREKAI